MKTITAFPFKYPFEFIIASTTVVAVIFLMTSKYYMLAITPPVALFALFLAYAYPKFFYYAVVFMIPYGEYRKITEIINLPWILSGILVFVAFFQIFTKSHKQTKPAPDIVFFMILYFAAYAVSAIISDYSSVAYEALFLQAVAYIFVFLGYYFLENENDVSRTLPKVIIFSILISSTLGLVSYYFGLDFGTESYRVQGTSTDPNNASLMIIFSIPLTLHLMKTTVRNWGRFYYSLVILINVYTIIFTFSRGGTLIFIIAAVILTAQYIKYIKPLHIGFILTVLAIIAIASALIIPDKYWERQKSVFAANKDNSLERRASYLIVAKDLFLKKPVFGWGPNVFKEKYGETTLAESFTTPGRPMVKRKAHNTYVEILIGSGIIGFSFFMLLIGKVFLTFNKARKLFKERGEIHLQSAASAYQTSFFLLLIYLFIFSEQYHKYMLLSFSVAMMFFMFMQKYSRNSKKDES